MFGLEIMAGNATYSCNAKQQNFVARKTASVILQNSYHHPCQPSEGLEGQFPLQHFVDIEHPVGTYKTTAGHRLLCCDPTKTSLETDCMDKHSASCCTDLAYDFICS